MNFGSGIIGGIVGGLIANCFYSGSCNVFADYYSVGAQFAGSSLAAGYPLTFSTANVVACGISAFGSTVNSAGPTGTVFQLCEPGTYNIQWQAMYNPQGSLSLYSGTAVTAMTEVERSIVGHGHTNTTQINGQVNLVTTVCNTLFSINAAAGNANAITFPATSSTTNDATANVFIVKMA